MYVVFHVILKIGNICLVLYVFLGLVFYEKSLWVFGWPLGAPGNCWRYPGLLGQSCRSQHDDFALIFIMLLWNHVFWVIESRSSVRKHSIRQMENLVSLSRDFRKQNCWNLIAFWNVFMTRMFLRTNVLLFIPFVCLYEIVIFWYLRRFIYLMTVICYIYDIFLKSRFCYDSG